MSIERSGGRRRNFLSRLDPRVGAQVAGEVAVSAARMGRLAGRTGWRMARQLPGGAALGAVEAQTARIRHAAAAEILRMLELPQHLIGTASPAEQRAVLLVQNADPDSEPLRDAMNELLERADDPDRTGHRDYLFGTIVSQLVPDEARILTTLADGTDFALLEVVAKQMGRSATRLVLPNVSTVGTAAGIATAANTSAYIGRLRHFGLVEVIPRRSDELADQFDTLEQDDAVQSARAEIDNGSHGSSRVVRKVLRLSPFGAEFWAACAPSRPAYGRRR